MCCVMFCHVIALYAHTAVKRSGQVQVKSVDEEIRSQAIASVTIVNALTINPKCSSLSALIHTLCYIMFTANKKASALLGLWLSFFLIICDCVWLHGYTHMGFYFCPNQQACLGFVYVDMLYV
jgi:hypothetical protein